jgi:serine/threonine protein kinase
MSRSEQISRKAANLTSFDFAEGRRLLGKYEVLDRLGSGWEGEVYRVRELHTGIVRAAKFFYPKRNVNNRAVRFYARKLHKLRHCAILIQYYTQETIQVQRVPVTFLVSEYVEGEMLSSLLARQRGKRLTPFQAVHLLHALATGLACIHQHREYHGDLHTDNIMVRRLGLSFDLKVIDMFHWRAPKRENIQDDVVAMIQVFHEALGGAKHYRKHPPEVKQICLGLKRTLIAKRFPAAKNLRDHLERMTWS